MLGLAPSSYYYKSKEQSILIRKEEVDLRGHIEHIAC